MARKILLVLFVVVVGFLAFVATRPDSYHVERSTQIAAGPEAIFAVLGDFKNFPSWSPWQRRDPAMHVTLSNPSAGVGASYAWEGNKEVGKGRMTFTEVVPPTRVHEKLEFLEPFPSTADSGFTVKPDGPTSSTVTWSLDGRNNFVAKAFSVFMNMDKMIGGDFAEGLANLKRVVESHVATPPSPAAATPPPAP